MRAKLEESAAALEAAELDARRLQCANALHEMRNFVRASRDADDLDPAVHARLLSPLCAVVVGLVLPSWVSGSP